MDHLPHKMTLPMPLVTAPMLADSVFLGLTGEAEIAVMGSGDYCGAEQCRGASRVNARYGRGFVGENFWAVR